MNNLIVHNLYIFEPKHKIGKRVDFEAGINVITSDIVKGNDVGKSIILKSIYHTLGADSIFDDLWKESPKVYLLNFSINKASYHIFRSDKLFKIYTGDFEKLFSTINRAELAEYLKELYGFSVKLPNKYTEEMETASPVFSYLLNYVDQDQMNGPKFNSFESLFQYKNDKNDILFNHFGIYTDEYFETIERIEKLKRKEKDLVGENIVIQNMLERIRGYLEGNDAPIDLEAFKVELEKSKNEYMDLMFNLKKHKNTLMTLRNERIKLGNDIKDLQKWKRMKEKDVNAVNKNYCPTCSQEVEDMGLKISQYNQLEDFYLMKNQLDTLLLDVERKIKQNEEHYAKLLKKLNQFEEEMDLSSTQISDVLKHRGYLETQNNMLKESGMVQESLNINEELLNENNNILKKYDDMKKQANESYEQLMIESVNRFALKEVSLDKIKKINGSFSARGSNIPISTIIWYFNLLKVKFELNPDAIRFPLVLDSPNNVELDEDKHKALFNYIFKNNNQDTQLIVSTLGFTKDDFQDVEIDNIINLEVRKYNLLNKEEYQENKELLNRIFEDK